VRSFGEGVETGGGVVGGEVVSAVDAIEVGDAGGAVAIATAGRDLPGALGAEVVVALDTASTGRTKREHRLTEQKIEDRADAAGDDHADDRPHGGAHPAAGRVAAYIADHEDVETRESADADVEVDAEAEGDAGRMVAVSGNHDPHDVLHGSKREQRAGDGPGRDETNFSGEAAG